MMRLSHRLIFAALLFLCASTTAFAFEGLENFMLKVSPGSKREEVLKLFGNPDSILSKARNAQGKIVEVWVYDPLVERNITPAFGALRSIGEHTLFHQPESEESKARRRVDNPPYVIKLVDGVVEEMGREFPGNAPAAAPIRPTAASPATPAASAPAAVAPVKPAPASMNFAQRSTALSKKEARPSRQSQEAPIVRALSDAPPEIHEPEIDHPMDIPKPMLLPAAPVLQQMAVEVEPAPPQRSSVEQKIEDSFASDKRLTEAVKLTLRASTVEGKIRLNGVVLNEEDKQRLEGMARLISENADIQNNITVISPTKNQLPAEPYFGTPSPAAFLPHREGKTERRGSLE